MRKLTAKNAIREAIKQSMDEDETVFVYGEGVDDAHGIFGTSLDLAKEFGNERVFDMPMSENAMTGVGVGAAIMGMKPIMVHQRIDFTLLALDQIVNHAAKIRYMWGGHLNCPFVIRTIIGRGWGQGAQHSQSFYSIFTHFPGMKVIVPSNAYDAKGLLMQAIKDENPVLSVEHKFVLFLEGEVPEEKYTIPFGKGRIVKEGEDVTVVAFSQMVSETEKAAEELSKEGINIEIIDPRTAYPLDEKIIAESVEKTGRLVIADIDWTYCGLTAEISAMIAEKHFDSLKRGIKRVGLPHTTHPSSYALEQAFFPNKDNVIKAVKDVLK
jgi:acetoin:2,6-dichlorophenolindophenol oxidoreductase subunit beta